MKRLNRLNFFIYILLQVILYFFIIFIILAVNINNNLIFIILIPLIILWWILIIKRAHDFWSKWIIHIFLNIIVPFYIFYLIFKKWDKWLNLYWQEDNKILFLNRKKVIKNESELHKKCFNWDIEWVKKLINNWDNIDIQNNVWSTPLMKAISANNLKIVKLLLEKWADVNILREDWYNSLFIAIHFWYLDIIKELLKYNVNVNFINKANYSSLDFAEIKGDKEIIKIIKKNII